MQIHIAKTLEEIQDVESLSKDKIWDHAHEFLANAPVDPFADHLRWLEADGHPVACVQIFLYQYPIGCAQIGMCLPEYPFVPPDLRGRSYFKHLMADLFDWMRKGGYPLAYDHGRKGLYTGLGFAPCFHHWTTWILPLRCFALLPMMRVIWVLNIKDFAREFVVSYFYDNAISYLNQEISKHPTEKRNVSFLQELQEEKAFWEKAEEDFPDAFWATVKKEVRLGMPDFMIKEFLGEPDNINRTAGDWGKHEQWIYENKTILRGKSWLSFLLLCS